MVESLAKALAEQTSFADLECEGDFQYIGHRTFRLGGRCIDSGEDKQKILLLAMTDVTVGCARYPELARTAKALAVQRRRAHVLLVADDERPDDLLADVLDERTANDWLVSREPKTEG